MIRSVLLAGLVCTVSCTLKSDHTRLMDFLLEDNQKHISKYVRPVKNKDYYMTIDLEFHLKGIKEVDFEKGEMETVGWIGYTWMNEYTQWKPEEFGGISEIRVPASMVWVPDVYLFNDASGEYNAKILSNDIYVLITNDGSCYWYTPTLFRSLCDLPDPKTTSVSCPLVFGSWTHHEYLVSLNSTESADLSNFSGNTAWELMEAKSTRHSKMYDCCPEPYVDITWDIKLQKRVPHPDEDGDDSEEK